MDIVIKTAEPTEVSAEELYQLCRDAFEQWSEAGLFNQAMMTSPEEMKRYVKDKEVYVALDAATGELLGMHTLKLNKRKGRANGANLAVSPKARHEGIGSRMLEAEAQQLRKAGYRYMVGNTAIPATWSVRWHLKNGYRIVGYSRSEKQNYASYIFRKQIAIDVRHHPADLFWTRPLAPLTAKIQYAASYLAINICKTRTGRLNWMGRMAKRIVGVIKKGK